MLSGRYRRQFAVARRYVVVDAGCVLGGTDHKRAQPGPSRTLSAVASCLSAFSCVDQRPTTSVAIPEAVSLALTYEPESEQVLVLTCNLSSDVFQTQTIRGQALDRSIPPTVVSRSLER